MSLCGAPCASTVSLQEQTYWLHRNPSEALRSHSFFHHSPGANVMKKRPVGIQC